MTSRRRKLNLKHPSPVHTLGFASPGAASSSQPRHLTARLWAGEQDFRAYTQNNTHQAKCPPKQLSIQTQAQGSFHLIKCFSGLVLGGENGESMAPNAFPTEYHIIARTCTMSLSRYRELRVFDSKPRGFKENTECYITVVVVVAGRACRPPLSSRPYHEYMS